MSSLYEKYRDLDIIVKTPRGVENIVSVHIEEYLSSRGIAGRVIPAPAGLLGIVFVCGVGDHKQEVADFIKREIPEASHILTVEKTVRARLDDICAAVADIARRYITSSDTFAIRTTRRGEHDYTSIDVNVKAGKLVQELTGAEVDLECPKKVIYVEIFHDLAAICVIPGEEEYKKLSPGKPLVLNYLRKIQIVQMPYTGPVEACRKMGTRIGRAAQTFEIGALYIAHYRPVSLEETLAFLQGVKEGIESRYQIQKRSYGRPVHKVPVYIYELYQYVREHKNEPIIVTDPRGQYIMHVKEKLAEIFQRHNKIHILIGAREGIPVGIFRYATLTIDLIPQITIATDYAITSTIIAITAALEEQGVLEKYETKYMKKKKQNTQ